MVISYCLIVDFVFKITHGVYLYMVEASPYFVVMNKKTPTVSLIIFFLLSKHASHVFADSRLTEHGSFRVKSSGAS